MKRPWSLPLSGPPSGRQPPGEPRYSFQLKNNYFTEMCSSAKEGLYLTLKDLVYHSTLGLGVIKKRKNQGAPLTPDFRPVSRVAQPPLSISSLFLEPGAPALASRCTYAARLDSGNSKTFEFSPGNRHCIPALDSEAVLGGFGHLKGASHVRNPNLALAMFRCLHPQHTTSGSVKFGIAERETNQNDPSNPRACTLHL
jgi:hypothetical protein